MPRSFGGLIFFGAPGIFPPTANQGTGAGQYSVLVDANGVPYWGQTSGSAGLVNFYPDNSNITRPYITFPSDPGQGTVLTTSEFKNAFGTAAGGPGNPFSGVAAGSTSAQNAQQTSVFGQAPTPWGFALIDVFAVYSVQTAALTAATLGVTRNVFSENAAYTQTTPLAATAIAVTTTTSATTPHVQRLTLTQPITFESTDFSTLIVTLALTGAGTTITRVYGIGMHVAVVGA